MKKLVLLFLSLFFILSTSVAQDHLSRRLRNILSEYHHVGPMAENGLIMVCKKDTEHCGCIDTMGKEVIPFKYGMNFFYFLSEQPQFNSVNRMVAAKPLTVMHAVYGIIDEKGNTILPFEYETDYHNFHPLDAYHVFKTYQGNDSKEKQYYGVVDSLGNIVFPFEYSKIEKVGDRSFIIQKNGKYGLLNSNGEEILAVEYGRVLYNQMYNLVFVQQNFTWGVYTLNGKEIIPIKYNSLNFTAYGHLIASTESRMEFYTPEGKLIKFFEVDYHIKPTNPKSPTTFPMVVITNNKGGVINAKLEVIVPFEYDYISSPLLLNSHYYNLGAGIYHVKKDGKDAYIDTTNNLLSGMWYDSVSYGGLVMKDSLWGWVNGQGQLQIPVMYKNIKPILAQSSHIFDKQPDTINRNYFIIKEKEQVGLIDYNNKRVSNYDAGIQEILSIYHPLNSEKVFIIAKKQGKIGALDQSGKTVIPFEYDKVEADFESFEHFKFGHYRFYKGKKRFLVNWDKLEMVKE